MTFSKATGTDGELSTKITWAPICLVPDKILHASISLSVVLSETVLLITELTGGRYCSQLEAVSQKLKAWSRCHSQNFILGSRTHYSSLGHWETEPRRADSLKAQLVTDLGTCVTTSPRRTKAILIQFYREIWSNGIVQNAHITINKT